MKKVFYSLVAIFLVGFASAQNAPQEPVYSLGQGITVPKLIHSVDAGYTDAANKDRLSGTVIVDFVVDKSGAPQNLKIIKSLGDGLDESAMAAIQQYQYQPATKDGQPVSVHFSATVTFTWKSNVQIWVPVRVPMPRPY